MSPPAVGANRLELIQMADSLAREKGIETNLVIDAIEEAYARAARFRYGAQNQIRAEINRESGEIRIARLREVVEEVEESATQIPLEEAQAQNPAACVGDMIAEDLPPMEFGRIAAQSAKQVIVQKVRDAERERQYETYKDRIGEIINGIVKRVEYGHAIIDIGQGEAVVRREELIPRENFHTGDRIRAYVYDVRRELKGPQIFLSRVHTEFMSALFAQEVPEIYDGIITIKAVARDPGSRAKIAVVSQDTSIDPVGACVGMRGSRVQAVVNELQGEKIDIIRWSPDPADFIVKALAPAQVVKVVLDEDNARVEAVVPDDQLSLAIGRRGQNVRLASQLIEWAIDILTEAEESERRQKEFATRSALFVEHLNVDEVIAQLLASEGFTRIEEVAFVDESEIAGIEGFDEEAARALQERAKTVIAEQNAVFEEKRKEYGVSDALAAFPDITPHMLALFGAEEIKTIEDLAGLAADELTGFDEMVEGTRTHSEGILETLGISREDAEALVMRARVEAGWIEPQDEPQDEPQEAESAENAAETTQDAEQADEEADHVTAPAEDTTGRAEE